MKLCIAYCVLSKVEEDGDQKTSVSSQSPRTHYTTQKPIHLIYTGIILNRMILEYDHLKEEWNTEKLYFSFKKRIVKKRMVLRFRQQKMTKLVAVNWSISV